jgi:hypothetical protein
MTLRVYLPSVSMVIIKKTNNNKCWCGYEKEPIFTDGGNEITTANLEIGTYSPQ